MSACSQSIGWGGAGTQDGEGLGECSTPLGPCLVRGLALLHLQSFEEEGLTPRDSRSHCHQSRQEECEVLAGCGPHLLLVL